MSNLVVNISYFGQTKPWGKKIKRGVGAKKENGSKNLCIPLPIYD